MQKEYYSLVATLRLYAGWLLAWYFLIYALGSYQQLRVLPFQSALLESLLNSSVVLTFAVASFFFLLLTSIHRALGRGALLGTALTVIGIASTLFVVANA